MGGIGDSLRFNLVLRYPMPRVGSAHSSRNKARTQAPGCGVGVWEGGGGVFDRLFASGGGDSVGTLGSGSAGCVRHSAHPQPGV